MVINLLNWIRKWQSRVWHIWILFVLLVTTACQPAQATSTSIQPTPSKIPIAIPTSTESAVIPPTAVDVVPAATLQPNIVTESTSTLTPNGPWLAYLQYGITIVNQDGTGQTNTERPGEFPVCNLDPRADIQESPLNRLVIFPGVVYLIQPGPTWTLVYREWPTCHTDFTGNEKGGLLAIIYRSTFDNIPELRIYELPSGKIRDQFPLMKCLGECNTDNMWWEIKWSPNGRYLAFPAALEGPSSDLYVYDSEDGSTRPLTSGPDDVGTIWWSPDGSQIIMGEILENNYPYTSSLWVVSVSDNEVRLLSSLGENSKGILGWLDDSRFIVYNGTRLANALDLPANNLRVVDKDTGEVTTLFNGSFMSAILDVPHETVVFHTNDEEPREGFEGPGVYIVSASNPKLRIVRDVRFMQLDSEVGLFVTDDPCESDPEGLKGFNYRGEWQCVRRQLLPESFSSPDGQWQVSLQNGFWLKTNDGQPIQISEETVTQIIWRLDSKGLFFIANQILYYVSLPELDVKMVDRYPGGDTISYQWVSNN